MPEPIGTTPSANPGGIPQTMSKPLPGAMDRDVKLNHKAFIYFMEFVLPKIAGAKGWWEEMCSNPLSGTKITPSDEAFALLCCKNMWDKWNADNSTTTSHHDQGKYTSSGTNRKYGGRSEQGLQWFNELFRRPSSIEARNGHQLLRVWSWISSGKSTIQMQVLMI